MARDVQVNTAGVRSVLKSAGVRSLLDREVRAAQARCNAAYGLSTSPRVEPYGSNVEGHRVTAVGRVWTRTKLARIDNLKNNTLKKGTGW